MANHADQPLIAAENTIGRLDFDRQVSAQEQDKADRFWKKNDDRQAAGNDQ